MKHQKLQNAFFCNQFLKELKHLKAPEPIGLLSHEAPEATKCLVL